ncbi:hypothetical protein Bca101_045034 [Brassica carinata]
MKLRCVWLAMRKFTPLINSPVNTREFLSLSLPLPYPNATFVSGSAATGSIPQWQIDEIFGLTDFDQSYEYMENNGSSKADTSRQGDSDSSSMMRSREEDGEDNNNCLGGCETSWAVPQIHSPPTASGLNWPRQFNHQSVFVPDISSASHNTGSSPNQRVEKRSRRRF